jgi:predicted nucleic acid-binding protein
VGNPKYLIDSGPLVAALNKRDRHHGWAVGVLRRLGEAPMTTESVLTEVCWHLRQSTAAVVRVLEMPIRGDLVINPVLATDGIQIADKIAKYGVDMDLADACLIRLSEIYPRAEVITIDYEHFMVYRRNRDQRIPLIFPQS